MNHDANVKLSDAELELLCQTSWILTKQQIVQKICTLFGHCAGKMQAQIPQNVWPAISATNPKIAKGEQYLQLPWVMLDYPRLFTPQNTAAIRCFCWWGNFMSITLQLSGPALNHARLILQRDFEQLKSADYYICISEDAWQHHFENDNYLSLGALYDKDFEELINSKPFVKLATKIPLQQWDEIESFLMANYTRLCQYLPMHPADATSL